ncbi:MAG: hypothetical protein QW797_04095 [Thermoproteota archaeon]
MRRNLEEKLEALCKDSISRMPPLIAMIALKQVSKGGKQWFLQAWHRNPSPGRILF